MSPTDGADVALIGHQESWDQISRMVHHLRAPHRPRLDLEALRATVPWVPPRAIVPLRIRSTLDGRSVAGTYVETFLTPDELGAGGPGLRRTVRKVDEAIGAAARCGARIAALGGFTSILVERRGDRVPRPSGMALTTGNTLTAALIIEGVERAAAMRRIPLGHATLLILGATGDIGSACARHFAPRVGRLVLVARRADRLVAFAQALRRAGADARTATDAAVALGEADVVIAVASLAEPSLDLSACRPGALVCDAGYPKNVRAVPEGGATVFHGGMGRVLGGWESGSTLLEQFYAFPAPAVAHGCLLEGVVLAMERRFEPFSESRGNITPERMAEIRSLARRHGIVLAPFFDQSGLWPGQRADAGGLETTGRARPAEPVG
ncbi:MAG: hypothetical protein ACM3NS_00315 [Deltaproteobacteria bacterium]